MALVQSTSAAIAGGAATVTLNGVSASNTLVLILGVDAGPSTPNTPAGFTPSNVPAAFSSSGSAVSAAILHNQAPSSGTNAVSVTYTAGGTGLAFLLEWSGMTASALDVAPAASNVTNGGTAGSNSIASGTLAQANEVIFALLMSNDTGSGTANVGISDPPSGFTSLFAQQDSTSFGPMQISYNVVSSTAGATASWTWTDTVTIFSQATLASFKLTAAAAPATIAWVS